MSDKLIEFQKLRRYAVLFVLVFTTGCAGTNLADQFFNASSSETGAFQVLALQHLTDGSEGEITPEDTKVITNDLGYTITLHRALVHFHSLYLISEGEDPTCRPGFDQEISLHATHDLMGEDLLTHLLGTALLPKSYWCRFELTLGSEGHHEAALKFNHPGEGEVEHSTGGSGEEIEDAFELEGSWDDGNSQGNFLFTGHEIVIVQGAFKTKEGEEVLEHPIHFHEGEDVINVLFGAKYDDIFKGVDFKNQSEEEQIHHINENLKTAVHQHTGDHHGSGGDAR